jgi:hypothetical protein
MNRRFSALLVFFMQPRSVILLVALFDFILIWVISRQRAGWGITCAACPWYFPWYWDNEPTQVTYLCSCPSSKSCLGIGCRPFNRRTSIVEYWLVLRVLPRRFPLSLAVFASRDIGSICSVVLVWAICLRADHLLLFRPLPYEDDM